MSFIVFSTLFLCATPSVEQYIETPPAYPSRDEIPASGEATITTATEQTIQDLQETQFYSPLVSQVFYEIGYELANSQDISPSEIEQAIIFLTAAANCID